MENSNINFFSINVGSINSCSSMDQTRNDNGYLACCQTANPGALNHGSTAAAVANLLNCLGGRKLACSIIGHGNDGIIVTGTGQSAVDPDKYISLWKQSYWQPHLAKLKDKVTSLALWACHPGTAADGATFLYNIAKVINAPVSGPTGFLYCDKGKLTLEAGSTWQVATPLKKPSPIAAPTPHLYFENMKVLKIRHENNELELLPEKIINIRLTSFMPNKDSGILSKNDIDDVLNLIDFSNPVQIPGMPAAIVTGEVSVTFEHGGKEIEKKYIIYNNRLLQDKEAPLNAYYCSESIANFLA